MYSSVLLSRYAHIVFFETKEHIAEKLQTACNEFQSSEFGMELSNTAPFDDNFLDRRPTCHYFIGGFEITTVINISNEFQ